MRDNKQFACLKPLLESENIFVHRTHQHQSNEFSAMAVCFSDLTEQWCPSSCCAIWCLPSATETVSDICVTFVAIGSITANAQLDAAIAVTFWFSLAFHCQTNDCTMQRFQFVPAFLANVRYMLSPVRLSVCRLSVVGNTRAPYSGGSNFRQYFYGIWYPSHPLTSTENFTEIVSGEPLRRGS